MITRLDLLQCSRRYLDRSGKSGQLIDIEEYKSYELPVRRSANEGNAEVRGKFKTVIGR